MCYCLYKLHLLRYLLENKHRKPLTSSWWLFYCCSLLNQKYSCSKLLFYFHNFIRHPFYCILHRKFINNPTTACNKICNRCKWLPLPSRYIFMPPSPHSISNGNEARSRSISSFHLLYVVHCRFYSIYRIVRNKKPFSCRNDRWTDCVAKLTSGYLWWKSFQRINWNVSCDGVLSIWFVSFLTQSFTSAVGSLKGNGSALLRRCKFNRKFSCAVQSCTQCIFYT